MPTLRQIAQATLLRFFPAAATGLLGLTAALVPGALSDSPLRAWLYLGGILGMQALGFAATMLRFRGRLPASAKITGSRSAIVGALSGGLLLVLATSGQTFLPQWGLWLGAALTGATAATAMYWPWLERRTPTALPRNQAYGTRDAAAATADKLSVRGRRRQGSRGEHAG